MNIPGLRAQLLPVFLEELDGEVTVFAATLPAVPGTPVDTQRLSTLFRIAHTLKGAARAVGVVPVEELCRTLEVVLTHAADAGEARAAELHDFLTAAVNALRDASRRLHAGQDLRNAPIVALAGRRPK